MTTPGTDRRAPRWWPDEAGGLEKDGAGERGPEAENVRSAVDGGRKVRLAADDVKPVAVDLATDLAGADAVARSVVEDSRAGML